MTEAATPIAPQYEDALQPGATRPLPSVEPPVGLKLPLDRDTAREFLAPAYCASRDMTRPILTGCYIEHGATRAVCVGTDTYRLHAVQLTEDAGSTSNILTVGRILRISYRRATDESAPEAGLR